ncbi:MAG: cobalamin-binding protein [Bryobacteraceae bacterium]
MQELRIVPLISSATEIVHALGLGQFQVGRSHECDYPACVADLPVCTNPTIAVSGSSAEIDRLVKQRLTSAASVYAIDSSLIRRLRPTHILTQTQCKVCAVSLEDVERAFKAEIAMDARIICLEPYALDDLWRDIRCVASGCGHEDAGEALTAGLQQRMIELQNRVKPAAPRPAIAAIEWLDPLMAAGNWVPELIEMAGGENLFGVPGAHSPWMTWDQLVAADPDVIVALPCGFDLAKTRGEMYCLSDRPGWDNLRAVQEGQVFVCDGNQFMNRPGPRLVESLQIFAEMLYPDLFEPQLEHVGWEHF